MKALDATLQIKRESIEKKKDTERQRKVGEPNRYRGKEKQEEKLSITDEK